jgi:DNA-binding beta-propeller fold protein YncE
MNFRNVVALTGLPLLLLSCRAEPSKTPANNALVEIADVPLPGQAVRFDYQNFDPQSGRLYIAHMNDDHLVVFQTRTRQVIANLEGFRRVHGVIAVPEINRVYASATGDHRLAVVDAQSLKTIATPGPIDYPDGVAYAPGAKRVFVSDEHGGVDAVIDATTNLLIAKIPLGGEAGNTVYDPVSKQIVVAVHGANQLAIIDPVGLRVLRNIPVAGVKDPHGVALDNSNHLAFVAGEGNHTLAVVDLTSGSVLATHHVGDDPDVLAWDPGLKRLYVSAESGDVTVFQQKGRTLEQLAAFHMPHAHSVAIDPSTHLVYFPLENLEGKPVLRIMAPAEPR